MQTAKFITLGCKVNQYETQAIREGFMRRGFKESSNGEAADIYVINTCTVTQAADRKSRQLINRAHQQNPRAKILVTGCYAELDSDIIKKIPGVTHIVKNRDKHRLIELFNDINDTNEINDNNDRGISNFSGRTRAFLKIQDGCDNHCSYCKVPLVRGPSRSRPLGAIIQEAAKLAKSGFKEIVLTGICLGTYGRDMSPKLNLISVIDALEGIDGLLRIRLSSIESGDVTGELIDKIRGTGKLCRHLHIPLQSGDDEILKKMNRSYTSLDFLNLINSIKKYIPEVAITTDVIVGFPGESEINFKNTLSLIKKISPFKAHVFPYSHREGTLAAKNNKRRVSPEIIKKRIYELNIVEKECSAACKKQLLNTYMNVMIESRFKDDSRFWQGYTDNYVKVLIESVLDLKGRVVNLKLKDVFNDFIKADFN